MEKLRSYRVFLLEIKELTKFLNSTKYAFSKTEAFRKFIKNIAHKNYLENNGFDTKPSGICSFNRNSVLSLGKTLNQQTFVRAISALEIFLIDIFRDVFIITKIPFMDQSKVHQYNQSQLLSFKSTSELFNQIINKECRNLSSGGFNEIVKAYKKRLDIDLFHISPGKQKMTEYHEIRHLIVHKLGRTDSQFRKKYNLNNKAGISLDDDYLFISIKDIKDFAEKTHQSVLNRINELNTTTFQQPSYERLVKYNVKILNTNSNLDFLSDDFEFWVNDEFEVLKNILIGKKELDKNEFEMILAGTKRQIRAYYSHLKFAKKNQNIKIKIFDDNRVQNQTKELKKNKKAKSIKIEDKILELIRQELPEQPWDTGVHKKVAEKLGFKNRVVYAAIKMLINKEVFKQQIDGVVIENANSEI